MKSQISLLALMCMMVSLTQPAWSMEEEDSAKGSPGVSLELRISDLKEKADQGDMKSQWKLAKLYIREVKNDQNERDWDNAVPLLEKLAGQRHRKAEYNLGYYYDKVIQDKAEAIKWYDLAANQGYAEARYRLAMTHMDGFEEEEKGQDEWDKIISLFTLGADQGHLGSQFLLATIYINGYGNELRNPELDKGIPWLKKAADQRLPLAQNILGSYYQKGEGMPKNMREAIKYYTLAAEQDYSEAQRSLAEIYKADYKEYGREDDRKKTIFWLTKAAEKGDLGSQFYLAVAYAHGEGNEEGYPENKKSIQWFASCAEQGFDVAQWTLGSAYHHGNMGLPIDWAMAIKWYTLAANQGHNLAQEALLEIKPERVDD